MIRLIKRINHEIRYWQVWKEGNHLSIQSGIVGINDEKEKVSLNISENARTTIKRLMEEKLNEGYRVLREKELILIVLQYRNKEEEFVTEVETKCLFIEVLLNHALCKTGNGEVAGYEMSPNGGRNHLYVVNVGAAWETILKELSQQNLLEGIEIACLNEHGIYVSLYPEGADFKHL